MTATGRPPVVLLHGAFADHHTFKDWVERFARAGHPAISPARRGRLGVGPDHASGLTFEDYLHDTEAVLDTLDQRPILVGHSVGALVAQKLAELGRASALVLVAPAPPGVLTAQPVALRRFLPLLPRIMAGRPVIIPPGSCSVLALNKLPEAQRPAVHSRLTHESGKVYRSMMLGTARVDARKVQVPVMVVAGTEDRIISTALARRTAKHYGVEARLCPGRGHWLIAEPGWERLVDEIVAWSRQPVAAPRRGVG